MTIRASVLKQHLSQARENVRKAVDIKDPNEKQAILGESLRLLLRAVRAIDFEKLREICGDYQHLAYARGTSPHSFHAHKLT